MVLLVGGIIASATTKNLPTDPDPSYMSNIKAFDDRLNVLFGSGGWSNYYGWVKPWDNQTIVQYVQTLCSMYDPNALSDGSVQAILVTGTTIGERVKAARDNYSVASKRNLWIVAATDDGDWAAQFTKADRVTGTTSGYSRLDKQANDGKHITWHRAKKLFDSYKQANGQAPTASILLADDSLLSDHARVEKHGDDGKDDQAGQIYEVKDVFGSLAGTCRITAKDNGDGSSFTFATEGGFFSGDVLVVLPDAVTFLNRQVISTIAKKNFKMSSGPHCSYPGMTSYHGPSMDHSPSSSNDKLQGRYYEVADKVNKILRGQDPGDPKTDLEADDVTEC